MCVCMDRIEVLPYPPCACLKAHEPKGKFFNQLKKKKHPWICHYIANRNTDHWTFCRPFIRQKTFTVVWRAWGSCRRPVGGSAVNKSANWFDLTLSVPSRSESGNRKYYFQYNRPSFYLFHSLELKKTPQVYLFHIINMSLICVINICCLVYTGLYVVCFFKWKKIHLSNYNLNDLLSLRVRTLIWQDLIGVL